MIRRDDIRLFLKAIPNSYGQVFFSDHRPFAFILMGITFFDLNAGILGLLSVITTNLATVTEGAPLRLKADTMPVEGGQ